MREQDLEFNPEYKYAKGGKTKKFPVAVKRRVDEINEMLPKVNESGDYASTYAGSTMESYIILDKPIQIKGNYVYISEKDSRWGKYGFEKRYNVNDTRDVYESIKGRKALMSDLGIIKRAFTKLLKSEGKMAKGGIAKKSEYISNRDIVSLTHKKGGTKKTLKGSQLVDGAYAKKKIMRKKPTKSDQLSLLNKGGEIVRAYDVNVNSGVGTYARGGQTNETINLKSYNLSGKVINSGKFIADYENETITFPSGKTYKVVKDYEWTSKVLKTKIKAIGGIRGFVKFLKEINTPDSPFNPSMTNAYINNGKKARGGKMQGYNAQLDESLAMRKGSKRTKQQSDKDRRDESKAMSKSMGRRAYAGVRGMDKGRRKMAKGGVITIGNSSHYTQEETNNKAFNLLNEKLTSDKSNPLYNEFQEEKLYLDDTNGFVSIVGSVYDDYEPSDKKIKDFKEYLKGFLSMDSNIYIKDKIIDYKNYLKYESMDSYDEDDYYAKGGELSKSERDAVNKIKSIASGYIGKDFLDKNPSDRDVLRMIKLKDKKADIDNEIARLRKQYGLKRFATGGKITMAGDTDFPSELLNYAKGGKFASGGNVSYNGWTNYATWVTNLEILDGMDWKDYNMGEPISAEMVQDYVNEVMEQSPNLALSFANRFLNDVNYYEIVEHINDEFDLDDGEKDEYAKGGKVTKVEAKKRLEEIRKSLDNENISYGELDELQLLSDYIDKDDVRLREAAGLPEYAKGGKIEIEKAKRKLREAKKTKISSAIDDASRELDRVSEKYGYFAKGGQMKKPMIRYSGRR